ncbi:hypothetical protein OHQ89_49325 [Streptomyces canus]|uniref:hypothetical protein n=1 Tax=Streptomyces canus TaxID=58343 RepID=UPI0030E40EE2
MWPISAERRSPSRSLSAAAWTREALQVLAGGVFFDAADVSAGAGIEPAGQVLGEQRSEEHRREHEVGGDAAS